MFQIDYTQIMATMQANQQQRVQMEMFENSLLGQQMAAGTSKMLGEGATIFDDRIKAARADLEVLLDKLEAAATAERKQRIQQSIDDVRGDIQAWTSARDRILVGRS